MRSGALLDGSCTRRTRDSVGHILTVGYKDMGFQSGMAEAKELH